LLSNIDLSNKNEVGEQLLIDLFLYLLKKVEKKFGGMEKS